MECAVPTTSSSAAGKGVPEVIIDRRSNKEYARGKFLGKGSFAKCYEFVDKKTKETFAGKVVSKELLLKPRHRAKMVQEIQIHRTLSHQHIVAFHSYFEDDHSVYIILELCSRRSLMEMHRRRGTLTEGEARYFLRQLLLACRYLREQRIIHRDLKLSNLLLNEAMELKVADFGLATRITFDGERKKTLCGTPSYIAPEVLSKTGHSFEVDVWSIGCILYTMLVGHTPFEASTTEQICALIKQNKFHLPPTVSAPARALIRRLLQQEPQKRPSIDAILEDSFITGGPLPSHLPTSCLVIAPRFDTLNNTMATDGRRPLLSKNEECEPQAKADPAKKRQEKVAEPLQDPETQQLARAEEAEAPPQGAETSSVVQGGHREQHLKQLQRLLQQLFSARPPRRCFERPDEAGDPASAPVFWISKWVDYADKYGIGYQLGDGSIGVLFNDNTRLVLLSNKASMIYVDESGVEHYHTLENHPSALEKRTTLLKYFSTYMEENLTKTGRDVSPRECDDLVRLPCLGLWWRTNRAIAFYLTNGTVQVNFLHDHTKLILCPLMGAVTYIDTGGTFRTYRMKTLHQGCPPEMQVRLKYALKVIDQMTSA